MAKTKTLSVKVEPEFHERLQQKCRETAVPYSEVARRAWEVWLLTGELPQLPKRKEVKRKET